MAVKQIRSHVREMTFGLSIAGKGVAGGLNKRSKMVVENICETKEGLCCFYHLAESVGGHLFCIVWQFCPCFICGLFNALHGDAGRTGLDALQSHKCRDG